MSATQGRKGSPSAVVGVGRGGAEAGLVRIDEAVVVTVDGGVADDADGATVGARE